MTNERLRACITAARLTVPDVAGTVGVDPKTVERWIAKDRLPHRTHRQAMADLLTTEETYLWPQLLDQLTPPPPHSTELVAFYPSRGMVPGLMWRALIEAAQHHIDVLVYAGLFLPDGHPELAKDLIAKAQTGTKIRFALGDPTSAAVLLRGEEEAIGESMAARARLSLTYLREAIGTPGIDVRMHATTLYNSIYRFDDDMLVNTHVYGAPAAQSPVLHLRRLAGGRVFDHYARSIDRVWACAKELDG